MEAVLAKLCSGTAASHPRFLVSFCIIVKSLDLRLRGFGFNSWLFDFQQPMFCKLFTHKCLCWHPYGIIWYRSHGRDMSYGWKGDHRSGVALKLTQRIMVGQRQITTLTPVTYMTNGFSAYSLAYNGQWLTFLVPPYITVCPLDSVYEI